MGTDQQAIEKIDPCWVAQFTEDKDRIVGPKRYSVREVVDLGHMERKVAQIIG